MSEETKAKGGPHPRSVAQSNCNQVQMDWRQIGINYLRLWFWIDVISVLPWQYMDFSVCDRFRSSPIPSREANLTN